MNYYDRKRVSASLIKKLIELDSWELAISEMENSESDAMREGTLIHSYLLESSEPSEIHKERYEIYKPFFDNLGGEREKEFYFEFEAVKCKSKIDLISKEFYIPLDNGDVEKVAEFYDLKTTSNIKTIEETIDRFNYKVQIEFYRIALNGMYGNIVFVDKNKRASFYHKAIQPSKANLNIIKDTIFKFYKEITEWQE